MVVVSTAGQLTHYLSDNWLHLLKLGMELRPSREGIRENGSDGRLSQLFDLALLSLK